MSAEKLVQRVVAAFDLVARDQIPLGKNDGFAVCLLHGERITAENVLVQDEFDRLPALVIGLRFGVCCVFLIPDFKELLAANLSVVL